jgi:hypothetical protein
MSSSKFITDTIVCINLGQTACKIIIPISMNLRDGVPLSKLLEDVSQQQFADYIFSAVGYFKRMLRERGMKLTEIDILLPIQGQYIQIEKRINDGLAAKYKITIMSGAAVHVPGRDINANMRYVEQQIKDFSENSMYNA